jgi:hypothetical protein
MAMLDQEAKEIVVGADARSFVRNNNNNKTTRDEYCVDQHLVCARLGAIPWLDLPKDLCRLEPTTSTRRKKSKMSQNLTATMAALLTMPLPHSKGVMGQRRGLLRASGPMV